MQKMDEMDKHTRTAGITGAWFFLVLALGAWTIVELIRTGSLPLAGVLLVVQYLIYFVVVNVHKRRLGDDRVRSSGIMFIVLAVAALGFGVIAWLITG